MNKNYKDLVCEEFVDDKVSKEEVVEALLELSDLVDSPTEEMLIDLILSLVKMDMIDSDSFSGIFDALDEIEDAERDDQQEDDVEDAEDVSESQKPLYRKKGYVKCPNGRIRKRGKCGKAVDKVKSRKMRLARKKHKQSYKKAQRKTRITKRRLGQQK